MPKKKVSSKRIEKTWDQIGADIGTKVEKYEQYGKWKNCGWWSGCGCSQHGGGFGRLLFILGIVFAMNEVGMLAGIPWWTTALVVLGFWWMRL